MSAPKLGIIAGSGALPGLLVAACAANGRDHYVLGLNGFADETRLPHRVDSWIRLGEIGKGFDALRAANVAEVVMAGGVKRPSFTELKPDLKGAAFLARIAGRSLGDDGLLSAVVHEIEREGFRVVGADDILHELLAPEGVWGKHAPDAQARADIAIGIAAARAIGAADVGQAAIVLAGAVLGVEDAAGTDALMARCAGKAGVLVKAKKPQQDRRADLPAIGPETIARATAAGLRGIAVEAGQTLVIDRAGVIAAADAAGLFVVGVAA